MDVRMPDGTIIKNAPAGTTQADLMARYQPATEPVQQPEIAEQMVGGLENAGQYLGESAQAFGQGVTQGATAGFGDEIKGMIGAGYAKMVAPELFQDQSVMDTYKDARNIARSKEAAVEEKSPYASVAGQVVGAVGTGVGAMKVLPAAAGKTVAGRTAVAGGMGGLYGAGEADELENIGQTASETGALSTALQLGIEGIVPGGKAIGGAARKVVQKIAGVGDESASALKALDEAGISPTLGAITESQGVKRVQNVLSDLPLVGTPLKRKMVGAFTQADEAVKKAGFTGKVTETQAGEVIQQGAARKVAQGRALSDALETKVDELIPGDAALAITPDAKTKLFGIFNKTGRTADTIETMIRKRPEFGQAIDAANDGTITYRALRDLRTGLNDVLGDMTAGGVEKGQARAVRGQLSDILMDQAEQYGGVKAKTALQRANKFYADFIDERKNVLDKIAKQEEPGKFVRDLVSGSKVGGVKAKQLLRNLDPSERSLVRDAVIDKLGTGSKSQFSISSYFSEFGKMTDEAKRALFQDAPDLLSRHNQLADAMQYVKDLGKFTNNSGSGTYANIAAMFGAGGTAALTGAGGTAVKVAIGGRALSELMANEKFVRALATAAKVGANPANADKILQRSVGLMAEVAQENPEYGGALLDMLSSE